ncbi:MAG: biotin/lipoyl-binding protein [Planctomycetes bacterium]|nr:biotin/lipoyl-binding protein [Planctomycetota bacterium]
MPSPARFAPFALLALVAPFALFAACGGPATPAPAEPGAGDLVCTGRIEPEDGEVEVSAQLPGTITAIHVQEGERIGKGALLATLDVRQQEAAVLLAEARLLRVEAGNGKEEIAAVEHQQKALEAELVFAKSDLARAKELRESTSLSEGDVEMKQGRVDALTARIAGLGAEAAALRRGPLPEEVAVAKAELEVARTNLELRFVRAETAGTVLHLYRRVGDYVGGSWPTPLLRLADTSRLRVRIEVGETEAGAVAEGLVGTFTVFGTSERLGEVTVKTVLPSFGPKRLFDPDGAARVDTRTLQAICELRATGAVYSGQRVLVRFPRR